MSAPSQSIPSPRRPRREPLLGSLSQKDGLLLYVDTVPLRASRRTHITRRDSAFSKRHSPLHNKNDSNRSVTSTPDSVRRQSTFSYQPVQADGAHSTRHKSLPTGDLKSANSTFLLSSRSWPKTRGLILVTGATGSGKHHLAAMINAINNQRAAHIVSIEDPIDCTPLPKIAHYPSQVGLTPRVLTGLRYVLRQGPDVILIGEMRDRETMSVAISAALTGISCSPRSTQSTPPKRSNASSVPIQRTWPQAAMDLCQLRRIRSQRLLPEKRATAVWLLPRSCSTHPPLANCSESSGLTRCAT